MAKYVALLRAINVAGHACVTMDRLREAFSAADCRNVRTYIQSGNVLFESSARSPEAMIRKIAIQLRTLLGAEPGIVLRTLCEVQDVVRRDPFHCAEPKKDIKLYVSFLSQTPRIKPQFPLSSPKEALEALGMTAREVFVISRRKKNGSFGFPNNFVEQCFGVSATTRNWSTVTKLVDRA